MKPLALFYLLVFYIFLQFCWWTYLLAELNNEVYLQKLQIARYSNADFREEEHVIREKLHYRWLMIAGEGSVFIILLGLGVLQTRKAFVKEADLNKLQKNFLLSITHELKSPIASVKLYLQTIQKHGLEKEKQDQFIRHAVADTDRLHALVENILAAAKIENSTYTFLKERVNLSDLAAEVASHFPYNAAKKIIIEQEITPGIFLTADKYAMMSVISNLLDNAVKYSLENTKVVLLLAKANQSVVLSVADEGPGVAESEKEKVFRKFYRAGNEDVRSARGTGLGLYIVNYLVRSHGGQITIRNNSPKGSIFEVVFRS